MTTVTRQFSSAWRQVVSDHTRPHAGPFERMTVEAEQEFEYTAQRLERIDQCRRWLSPGVDLALATSEVTPGGLTFQDAALQCLQGGCHQTLVEVSRGAWFRAVREARVTHLHATVRAQSRLLREAA